MSIDHSASAETENANANADSKEALHQDLAALNLEGHWQRLKPSVRVEPSPRCDPAIWRWDDIVTSLKRAAKLITLAEDAERRTVRLINPALRDSTISTLHTLHTSVQLVGPGETAEAHRHSMGAIRFALAGDSTVTTVRGEPMPMHPRDLILTPKWTWHDHVNAGETDSIWIDGLDSPLIQYFGIRFQEPFESPRQERTRPEGDRLSRYSLLRAADVVNHPEPDLPLRYPWEAVAPAVEQALRGPIDPFDGVTLEYTNPSTNGHTLPTMACQLRALPAGFGTEPIRRTSAGIFHVLEGSGTVTIGDQTLTWGEGDFFTVPNWSWHHFTVDPGHRAVFFTLNDLPQVEAFGFYREETSHGLSAWGAAAPRGK
jgi:gentisate 1,2-dioxygenase